MTSERAEFLGDIITTAVEGGTGYWAQVSQYQWVDGGAVRVVVGGRVGDQPRAALHPLNDYETGYVKEPLILTPEVVKRGIDLILAGDLVNPRLREDIRRAARECDAGQLDADSADVIVQAGLLGEVVYG